MKKFLIIVFIFCFFSTPCEAKDDSQPQDFFLKASLASLFCTSKYFGYAKIMGIEDGLIEAGVLMQVLDDDLDNDMCDYRFNRNGGDVIENDPLIIDLRNENDYNLGHIPSAIMDC